MRRGPGGLDATDRRVRARVRGSYTAFVKELPGANTQAAKLEEARESLREAVTLVLAANRELAQQTVRGHAVTREPLVLSA